MKKILIVEDDKLLIKALSAKLREEKFEVLEAYDGEEGLIVAKKKKPDLILCDINMPKKDGLTMVKELRDTDWGANLTVIMLTNYSDKEKVSEALNQYVFRYLVKSDWDLDQIADEIKKKLK
jgi:DNA-binding response OmpR family regulator